LPELEGDALVVVAAGVEAGRERLRVCSVAPELAAMIVEEGFESLKAPIRRVGIPNVPIPYHEAEEDFITPTAAKIVAAARIVCGK